MANAEHGSSPEAPKKNATELAHKGQERRKRGITGWLLSRGVTLAALGTLGVAAYLAIAGGTAAAVVTAPLAVSVLGVLAVVGASLFAAGAVRGIVKGA